MMFRNIRPCGCPAEPFGIDRAADCSVYLHTLHLPPALQCLQLEQFLHAVQVPCSLGVQLAFSGPQQESEDESLENA